MRKIFQSFYTALLKMLEDDGIEHAGYMAFMMLLSLFPFIVFFLAFTSFLGALDIGEYFVRLFLSSMPESATLGFAKRIEELLKSPPQSLMTLAIIGTIWTASSFVEGIRTILNKAYGVKTPPRYLRRRLLSIVQFLAISFFISFATLLLVIVPLALSSIPEIDDLISTSSPWIDYARYILIFISLIFTVVMLYYIIPNTKLKVIEVLPGAMLTVILWIASGYILSEYISDYTQLDIVYGSLGSIIVSLVFFYIVNMIFIYGAHFNKVLRDN